MDQYDDQVLHWFLREEFYQASIDFEHSLVEHGQIPDARKLLIRRLKPMFQWIGGLILAVMGVVIALMMNFIIFNKILHI